MKKNLAVPFAIAGALAFGQGPALAETTVKWLHIEATPAIVAAMEQIARDYEADHPDVTIEMQFLENEAFKAKLTTLLQSDDRPDIFYSWGGGVFEAQVEAGVLRDIDDLMRGEWEETLSPAAVNAFTYDGKVYGTPHLVSQVGFWYNKDLFDQASVNADDIKTWDDLLGTVQTLKDAGITPIAVGGAEKWPLHFYWTHLAIRAGGKEAFEAANSGEGDGFGGPVFVRAGEEFTRLSAMEPFPRGFLANTFPESAGYFGDGNAAMQLQGNWSYNTQRTNSVSKDGLSDDNLGWFPFPLVEGSASSALRRRAVRPAHRHGRGFRPSVAGRRRGGRDAGCCRAP